MFGQFWSNSAYAQSGEGRYSAPSVCILIYNENICFCQPYSQHKYRVDWVGDASCLTWILRAICYRNQKVVHEGLSQNK